MKIISVLYNNIAHTVVLYNGMSVDELIKLLNTTVLNDITHNNHHNNTTDQPVILGFRCIDSEQIYTVDDIVDNIEQLSNNVELVVKSNDGDINTKNTYTQHNKSNYHQRTGGLFSPFRSNNTRSHVQPTSPNFMLKNGTNSTYMNRPSTSSLPQYSSTRAYTRTSGTQSNNNNILVAQLKNILKPIELQYNNKLTAKQPGVKSVTSQRQLNNILHGMNNKLVVVLTVNTSSAIRHYYRQQSSDVKYNQIEFIELVMSNAPISISFYLHDELLSNIIAPSSDDIHTMLDKCAQLINDTQYDSVDTNTDNNDVPDALSALLSPPRNTAADADDHDSINDDTLQFRQLVSEYEQRYNRPPFTTTINNNTYKNNNNTSKVNNWTSSNLATASSSNNGDTESDYIDPLYQSNTRTIPQSTQQRPYTGATDSSFLSNADTYKLLSKSEASILDALISRQDKRVQSIYRIYPEIDLLVSSYVRLARHVLEQYNHDNNQPIKSDLPRPPSTTTLPVNTGSTPHQVGSSNTVNDDGRVAEVLYDITIEMLKQNLLTQPQASFIHELHQNNNTLLSMAFNIFMKDRDVGALLQRIIELIKLLYKPDSEHNQLDTFNNTRATIDTNVNNNNIEDDTHSMYATDEPESAVRNNTMLQRIEQAQLDSVINNHANTVQSTQLDSDDQQHQQTRDSIESLVHSIDQQHQVINQSVDPSEPTAQQLQQQADQQRHQLTQAKKALHDNFAHFIALFQQNQLLTNDEAVILLNDLQNNDNGIVHDAFIQFSTNQDIPTLITALKQIMTSNNNNQSNVTSVSTNNTNDSEASRINQLKRGMNDNIAKFIDVFQQKQLLTAAESAIILSQLQSNKNNTIYNIFAQFSTTQDMLSLLTALKQIAITSTIQPSIDVSHGTSNFSALDDTDLRRIEQHIKSLLPSGLKLTTPQESTLHQLIQQRNHDILQSYHHVLDMILHANEMTADNSQYTQQQQLDILIKYKNSIESFSELVLNSVQHSAHVELLNDSYSSAAEQKPANNDHVYHNSGTNDDDTDSVTDDNLQKQNEQLQYNTIQLARKLIDLMYNKQLYNEHDVSVLNTLLDQRDETTIATFISAIQSENWVQLLERTKTLVALQQVHTQSNNSNNSNDNKQVDEIKEQQQLQSELNDSNGTDISRAFGDVLSAMSDDELININERSILMALFEQRNEQLLDVMAQFTQHSNVEQLQKGIILIAKFYAERLNDMQQNSDNISNNKAQNSDIGNLSNSDNTVSGEHNKSPIPSSYDIIDSTDTTKTDTARTIPID